MSLRDMAIEYVLSSKEFVLDLYQSGRKGKYIVIGSGSAMLLLLAVLLWPSSDIPAGSIETISVKDSNGDLWELEPLRGQPITKFKQAGRPGEPLDVKAVVSRKGMVLYINAVVQGRAGEKYLPGAKKNGILQDAPYIEIYSEQHELLGSGKLEYG